MARRPAAITQLEVSRAIRAAQKAGAAEAEIRIRDKATIIIRFQSTGADTALEPGGEIVL